MTRNENYFDKRKYSIEAMNKSFEVVGSKKQAVRTLKIHQDLDNYSNKSTSKIEEK